MLTFPSVDAIMIVFPEEEGPNSLERSTLMVRKVPSTLISTFFMESPLLPCLLGLDYNGFRAASQGHRLSPLLLVWATMDAIVGEDFPEEILSWACELGKELGRFWKEKVVIPEAEEIR
jgi:hypothetical protein